jgi:hypothetical protein
VRKDNDLTTFIVPKVMKNPEALTFQIPMGLFRPVAGKLYLKNEWSYSASAICQQSVDRDNFNFFYLFGVSMIYSNKSFPSFSFCSKFDSILKFVILSVTVDLFSLQLGSQYQIHQVIIKLIAKTQ